MRPSVVMTDGSTPIPTMPTSTPSSAYEGMVSPTEVSEFPKARPHRER
jgi:hypothetical protein